MWLATKLAAKPRPAGKPSSRPDLRHLQTQLGDQAGLYSRLFDVFGGDEGDFEDNPDLMRGPDETIQHHLMRMQTAMAQRAQQAKEQVTPAPIRPAEMPTKFEWEKSAPESAPSPTSNLGLPQRIPGWYTEDAMDAPPPGYGRPPLAQRTPGAGYRPNYAPAPQSHEEWLRGLAEKGIYVNPDGTRMTPEQLALPQRRPPLGGGRNVWQDLLDRPAEYAGRHRAASKVVVAYVREKLADAGDDAYAAWMKRERLRKANGWDLTEAGSGNYYHKEINGKHHILMWEKGSNPDGSDDGWTHYISNSPHMPYGSSMGYGPFKDLGEAMVDAEVGPLRPVRFNDKTQPKSDVVDSFGDLKGYRPPAPPNRMQTLNGMR